MIFRHLLNMRSHPTWVRGLKPAMYHRVGRYHKSHPTWVRGLKQTMQRSVRRALQSHPTWVRGLKLFPRR